MYPKLWSTNVSSFLAKPNDENSAAGQFLAGTNGRGGMYYVAIASDDIENDIKGVISRGGKLAEQWDGKSAVFIDNETSLGLRIQIVPGSFFLLGFFFFRETHDSKGVLGFCKGVLL